MSEIQNYDEAVQTIKTAILQSQYNASNFEDHEGSNLAHICAKLFNECNDEIWNTLVPKTQEFPMEEFLSIGFSHHRLILSKTKDEDERIFYIKRCATERTSCDRSIGSRVSFDIFEDVNFSVSIEERSFW